MCSANGDRETMLGGSADERVKSQESIIICYKRRKGLTLVLVLVWMMDTKNNVPLYRAFRCYTYCRW
jgi:hypothetical protein